MTLVKWLAKLFFIRYLPSSRISLPCPLDECVLKVHYKNGASTIDTHSLPISPIFSPLIPHTPSPHILSCNKLLYYYFYFLITPLYLLLQAVSCTRRETYFFNRYVMITFYIQTYRSFNF